MKSSYLLSVRLSPQKKPEGSSSDKDNDKGNDLSGASSAIDRPTSTPSHFGFSARYLSSSSSLVRRAQTLTMYLRHRCLVAHRLPARR